jgi:plastocyanin
MRFPPAKSAALPLSDGPCTGGRTGAAREIRAPRKCVVSIQMRVFAVLLAALAIPLAAGCGGDEDNGANGAQATDGGGAQTIQVSATEFQFDPSDISAAPGEITFELTNDGSAPHALEIEGSGVEESSETIDGGDSTSLAVDLDEGTYEIYCPVGDHKDRGMVGTLTVGSAAGAGGGGTTTDGETETEQNGTETEDEDDDSGAGGGY